ncbi:hypothetical protein D9757_012475 [Collybiopsis confluens]|uniref:HD domain-containing protein n=1 Tax=Collybiopsis confluens TaxID=2823264 RepID=A0A8H5LGJ4_9AGAR|nr:hypothetical protein D9757_012475 [Collybiopsis confluens]
MASTTILGSRTLEANRIVDDLFNMLSKYGQGDYLGEQVSQLEHSLQAANCAKETGSSNTTVLAALLHDCGHILPNSILVNSTSEDASSNQQMTLSTGQSVGRHGHDILGGNYLASLGFPPQVYELVQGHVVAKRYLTAVEEEYYNGLSDASKRSLGFQGGPFSQSQVESFRKEPFFQEKVQLRRFDDAAKVVGAQVPPLDAYRELAIVVLQQV